jgi:hypothetical protein
MFWTLKTCENCARQKLARTHAKS